MNYLYLFDSIGLTIKIILDVIVEIGDDNNDKLVVKPNLPQVPGHNPTNSSGVGVTIFINKQVF